MKKQTKSGKGKKILKIVLIVLAVLIVASIAGFYFGIRGYMHKDDDAKIAAPGNVAKYDVANVEPLESSPLRGKSILFLGSSVTNGDAAQDTSFADYIGKLDGVKVTKKAVGGTTLVDEFSIFAWIGKGDGISYVSRLKGVDKNENFEAVVVQLSTNDATMSKPLGELSPSVNMSDFDTKTITGAMEYIIAYVKETWGCPVIFYTGAYFEDEGYSAMVGRLHEVQNKWGIGVIDLYSDAEFNDIDAEQYDFYMFDKIHPTKAGYLEWWTPAIEVGLYDLLK